MTLDYQRQRTLVVWDSSTQEKLRRDRDDIWVMPNGDNMQAHPQGKIGIHQRVLTLIDNSKKYVLVVDDNQMISFVLQETLKSMD